MCPPSKRRRRLDPQSGGRLRQRQIRGLFSEKFAFLMAFTNPISGVELLQIAYMYHPEYSMDINQIFLELILYLYYLFVLTELIFILLNVLRVRCQINAP